MKIAEAIAECERWWAYLEWQRTKSVEVQRLARLARTGEVGSEEARKRLRQIDMATVVVYDAPKLLEATQCLVKAVRVHHSARDAPK